MCPTLSPRAFFALPALFAAAAAGCDAAPAAPQAQNFRGSTMGTYYAVTVVPPASPRIPLDGLPEAVDAELRRVNDQMSTYLPDSEISRFNASDSTDWFAVSAETAAVVAYAQEVAAKTEGAFDVTIAPLVDAWSFGPGRRTRRVPEAATIEALRARVGYERLAVREDPPALRKSRADLTVDLSAIAKGHGVDRVIDLLREAGYRDALVDVGGEVRAIGERAGGGPWRIGIERPAEEEHERAIEQVVPLDDAALATSGDYRNFFTDASGTRYSHTIDPRTGRPITHDLASVSVLADTCMRADAWATAINVLGAQEGLAAARREPLDVLLIRRENGALRIEGTGTFESTGRGAPPPEPSSPDPNHD